MIRLAPITKAVLEKSPPTTNWFIRASALTAANRLAAEHTGSKSANIWSEIKPLLIKLQRGKCAYCERRLGAAGIECDVEHLRPKGRVDLWQSASVQAIDAGGASPKGYYLLSYDIANYVVSCKTCNSKYKRNFFPTFQARQVNTADPIVLRSEVPFLILPADPAEPDPESLITYVGAFPIAALSQGLGRLRALVTIELLGLAREDLVFDRCQHIVAVWLAYDSSRKARTARQRAEAVETLDTLCADHIPFAACARAFRRLCESNPISAKEEYKRARNVLNRL